MFPVVRDADYIILLTKNRIPYPLDEARFEKELAEYRSSDLWLTVYEQDELIIMVRK